MQTRWTRRPRYSRQTQQTTLGKSVEGNLAIQKTKASNCEFAVDASRPAYILQLPDEVLSLILEFAITETDSWHKESPYNKALIPALAYTCHRFSRIIISFNYHTLHMAFPRRMIYPVCKTRKLVKTLEANLSLGRFCQSLSLYMSDVCPTRVKTDSECLDLIIPELKNVKYLTVHGGFEPGSKNHTWDIIQRCSKHMPRLEQVLLAREAFTGPGFADILQNLQIPMLQELYIHGSSEPNTDVSGAEVAKPVQASDLTKLHLSDFKDTSATMNTLIHWPKSLFEFSIENIHSDPDHRDSHPNYLDLPLLRKMLDEHRDTLTTLSIGPLSVSGRGRLANLSDLSALHTLSLSRWQLGGELDVSSDVASQLLGPSLELFVWDFTLYDQTPQKWSDFGTQESLWIMNLAQEAVERRSPLKEIRIQFSPVMPASEDEDYPWDFMDDLNLQFRSQGVTFTYVEPTMSKEAFSNRSKPTE
ncbi:uncharacterized protein N7484_007346 [Penicillium longicatenatum]|uniref:uncharacterized protein n=1 Tax=Penicillium longicatenatum TaxID=1561947 RepID=UPI002547A446|nr:uncharacterized protein N7484_007346 [Penicillium longicatenatum]KAJ5639484.1 hypothetical protein N7484_007346 [Penicillium longicatenatum]